MKATSVKPAVQKQLGQSKMHKSTAKKLMTCSPAKAANPSKSVRK